MLIAQLSDLHVTEPGNRVFNGRDSATTLLRCLATLRALQPRPALVMLSGDLVEHADAAEYARLRSILAELSEPYYLMPGNHDDAEQLRNHFPTHRYLASGCASQFHIDTPALRILALDTTVADQHHGWLGDERLAWLERMLRDARDKPCFVFMHHPPLESGIDSMDDTCVGDAAAFWAVVQRYPNVRRVACGHLHRAMSTQRFGIPVSVAPSTVAQLKLSLSANAPLQVSNEPPAFLLHDVADGRWITHCISVPEPHPDIGR